LGTGNWKKDRRNWNLEPRPLPSGPLMTKAEVARLQAARPKAVNPFELMNGGFQAGDLLVVDWMDEGGYALNGCRLSAYRSGTLLRWTTSGHGRDAGGRCLYLAFLTSHSAVEDFVCMLATASGYIATVLEKSKTRQRFALESVTSESRRLISGDYVSFNWEGKSLQVQRPQGTVDMNLFRPGSGDKAGVIMDCSVSYISLYHHPSVIVRILAEVNALQTQPWARDIFLVVPR